MSVSDDRKQLEYYLRYLVSQHNKKLSGKCTPGEHSTVFNKLVGRFCMGDTNNSSLLNKIFYYLEKEKFGKDLRPYAFFDIDTLIAYNAYLEKVRFYAKDGVSISRAIDYAMKDLLSSRTPLKENGYYKMYNPVVLRTDEENSQVKPLKRLSSRTFESRYNMSECRRLLDEYIEEHHSILDDDKVDQNKPQVHQLASTETDINNPLKSDNEECQPEVVDEVPMEKVSRLGNGYFIFREKRYQQTEKIKFLGIGERKLPIYKIVGRSLADDHDISLLIDVDDNVYEGKVYILGTQECLDFALSDKNKKDSTKNLND